MVVGWSVCFAGHYFQTNIVGFGIKFTQTPLLMINRRGLLFTVLVSRHEYLKRAAISPQLKTKFKSGLLFLIWKEPLLYFIIKKKSMLKDESAHSARSDDHYSLPIDFIMAVLARLVFRICKYFEFNGCNNSSKWIKLG